MTEVNRGTTERGFTIYDQFTDTYGKRVCVQESSLATEFRCWIFVDGSRAGAHLNVSQAIRVRDALDAYITEAHEQETQGPS
jgi:hypothetical protein